MERARRVCGMEPVDSSGRPNLPPWVTADLAAFAVDFRGDFPQYGQALAEVVEVSGWSWLEAAILAGHVPHLEGTSLALRAAHAWYMSEVRGYEAQGVIGDALGWANADAYREMIAMLEGFVAEMERETARLSRVTSEQSEVPCEIQARWAEDAEAAEGRAENAIRRQVGALADTDSARRQRRHHEA
jgi:hypothetical protein